MSDPERDLVAYFEERDRRRRGLSPEGSLDRLVWRAVAERYFVIVYAGSSRPEYVRSIGPFPTVDDANRAWEREGLGERPGEREWATVIPDPSPAREGDD